MTTTTRAVTTALDTKRNEEIGRLPAGNRGAGVYDHTNELKATRRSPMARSRIISPLRRLRAPARLALLVVCTAGLAVAGAVAAPAPVRDIPVGREPSALAVASRAGRVFVANQDDASVTMLDAASGAVLRTTALGHHPRALVVDAADARVLTLNSRVVAPRRGHLPPRRGDLPGTVSVLDAGSGALLRTVPVGAGPLALAVDERTHHAFVMGADATVRLLDARSGALLSTVALDGMAQALAVDAAAGRVVVGTNGLRARLLLLDSRTGRPLHSIAVGRSLGAVVAVPQVGRVVAAGDGVLRLLDMRSGALVGTVRAWAVPLPAVVGSDRVLMAGAAGLRLLDARSGRWAGPWVPLGENLPPDWNVAVDGASGRIVVVTLPLDQGTPGHLYVLGGRSGAVRRRMSAGVNARAVAVDARTRHAFILHGPPAESAASPGAGALLLARGHHWLPWLPLPWLRHPSATGSVSVVDLW
jgi:hypothetical protein